MAAGDDDALAPAKAWGPDDTAERGDTSAPTVRNIAAVDFGGGYIKAGLLPSSSASSDKVEGLRLLLLCLLLCLIRQEEC